jgi:hypothetical protein
MVQNHPWKVCSCLVDQEIVSLYSASVPEPANLVLTFISCFYKVRFNIVTYLGM